MKPELTEVQRIMAKLLPIYAEVRSEGYRAGCAACNPYPQGSMEHEAWRYGQWTKRQEHQ